MWYYYVVILVRWRDFENPACWSLLQYSASVLVHVTRAVPTWRQALIKWTQQGCMFHSTQRRSFHLPRIFITFSTDHQAETGQSPTSSSNCLISGQSLRKTRRLYCRKYSAVTETDATHMQKWRRRRLLATSLTAVASILHISELVHSP